MCEVILIKTERKGRIRMELKVSPQIAQVTNNGLIPTWVWEKVGKEERQCDE